jgi:hypothetical protein
MADYSDEPMDDSAPEEDEASFSEEELKSDEESIDSNFELSPRGTPYNTMGG